ncbi:hypothetical protein MMC25_003790 [Agyrium rufum]|nr:hypothetical protein [Agyrium rufum]
MPPSIIQKIIHPKASKEEEAAAAAEKNTEPSSSTETPLTEAPETTTGPSSSTPSKDPGPTTTTTTTTASTTAENMPPSSLPKTFKAAVFKEAGASLTLEDVEMKEPGEGEILIKVKACGVCHSDWNAQQGHFGSP